MTRTIEQIVVLSFITVCGMAPAFGNEGSRSFLDVQITPARNRAMEARGEMRADAAEVAELLRIKPLVEKIRQAKKQGILASGNVPRPIQNARLLCLWKLLLASEEVRKSNAAIDHELAMAYSAMDSLIAKRNMTINMLNTANFIQGGVIGCVRQGMGLSTQTSPLPVRQELAITSFGTGTLLSLLDLMVPNAFNRRIDTQSNSLAQFLGNNHPPGDAGQSYLWRYLNGTIPGATTNLTRRQILVKHWEAFAGIDSENEKAVKTLSSSLEPQESMLENASILNKRISLLNDLKSHIEEFDGCLFELHKAITGGEHE